MKIMLPGDYSQFTEQPYINLDPRYWFTESSVRWLLYLLIAQTIIFYSMPLLLDLLTVDTVNEIKGFCISLFNPQEKHLPYLQELDPEIIVSGFFFWVLFIPEVLAIYHILTKTGRDFSIPSLTNKEKPDIKGLVFEEMFIDRRKYIGKTKRIGLVRRVSGTLSSLSLGTLFLVIVVIYPLCLFVLKGSNLKFFVDHHFFNFILSTLTFAVFVNFMIVPLRDIFKAVQEEYSSRSED